MLSTLALMGAIRDVAPSCEHTLGIRIDADFAPTQALLGRLHAGERPDLVILTREGLDEAIEVGLVHQDSAVDLARSYVGIAVKAGGAHPDISTGAALRRSLIEARSVAYSRLGASGIYFSNLARQLGIADEINNKATIIQQGFTAERLLTGEADVAVQQISELKQVEGIEVIGPIPLELQTPALFSAGRLTAANNSAAAELVLEYLTSPLVSLAFRNSGLHP
jgi:molybdate transport system substrate-binding protein